MDPRTDVVPIVVQSTATGFAAAFGLTWYAVAAALIGAAASYHFEQEQSLPAAGRIALSIIALAFLAAMLASALTHLPTIFGFSMAEVPIAVRAGLLGLFANPIYKRLKREADNRNVPGV